MKISKKIQLALDTLKDSDEFLFEETKLDFIMNLERQRRLIGISYSDIAKKIQKSPAYVSKAFRGDSNFTIESMVKLAQAVGASLHVDLVDKTPSSTIWANCIYMKNNMLAVNQQYSHVTALMTHSKFSEIAA